MTDFTKWLFAVWFRSTNHRKAMSWLKHKYLQIGLDFRDPFFFTTAFNNKVETSVTSSVKCWIFREMKCSLTIFKQHTCTHIFILILNFGQINTTFEHLSLAIVHLRKTASMTCLPILLRVYTWDSLKPKHEFAIRQRLSTRNIEKQRSLNILNNLILVCMKRNQRPVEEI